MRQIGPNRRAYIPPAQPKRSRGKPGAVVVNGAASATRLDALAAAAPSTCVQAFLAGSVGAACGPSMSAAASMQHTSRPAPAARSCSITFGDPPGRPATAAAGNRPA